jgi:nucleoid DNA-binding protein
MNQQELIDAVTTRVGMKTGISKTTTKRVLDALSEVAHQELKGGGEITLPGIGNRLDC